MDGFGVWVADCHLLHVDDDEEYNCQAAVWADGFDTFRTRLSEHLAGNGLKILWLEDCYPASQYLRRHAGQQQRISGLARAVHPEHLVELGRLSSVGVTGELEEENYLTIKEHEIGPLPEQSGIPFWDQEWIAPELKETLFGQPQEGPKFRTYFIADATLRKKITGVFDLDSDMIDVPVQCLFKGEAAQDLKENAPYLIDMTLSDGAWDDRDKVPTFHIDFFKKHWEIPTGVFIRTPALMDEVWGHFRKFTRLQMEEDGRWVYFRFQEPGTLSAFVETLDEDDTHKFLGSHHLIIQAQATLKTYYATNPIGDNTRRDLSPLIMKNDYIKAFGTDRCNTIKHKIQCHVEKHSSAFDHLPSEDKSRIIDTLVEQALQCGIKIEQAVADFVLASIYFGRALRTEPQFERIIQSDKNPIDKGRLLLREVHFRKSAGQSARK